MRRLEQNSQLNWIWISFLVRVTLNLMLCVFVVKLRWPSKVARLIQIYDWTHLNWTMSLFATCMRLVALNNGFDSIHGSLSTLWYKYDVGLFDFKSQLIFHLHQNKNVNRWKAFLPRKRYSDCVRDCGYCMKMSPANLAHVNVDWISSFQGPNYTVLIHRIIPN